MKKDLGVKPYMFPMPVLMISTYGADGTVDVMNMAWGGVCAENMVALNIDEDHKTSENIKARGAFTLSIADIPHIKEADFFGIATGNKMPDKFARSGLHAVRSEKVDAPVVEEFPLTLECRVVECQHTAYGFRVLGEIVGVLAEEAVLDEKGRVDPPASTPLCSTSSRAATTPSARRWARPGTPAPSWQNKIGSPGGILFEGCRRDFWGFRRKGGPYRLAFPPEPRYDTGSETRAGCGPI